MDRHVGFIINFFIGKRIVDPDQHVTAAAVDDVLGLIPVEVVGGVLALLEVQQLFRVDLGILVRHGAVAVADGNQGKAELVEIPKAVVGDIPAQHAVPDFIILVSDFLPLLRSEMAEGRQIAVLLLAHGLQLFQRFVDLRTFHGSFLLRNP